MYPPEILDAIRAGDIEVVRRWLEEAPRDLSELVEGRSATGYEPLISFAFFSINYGHYGGDRSDLLQLLIAHGADVRGTDFHGYGALHRCEYPGEAAILLKHGADIDMLSHVRITPLMLAARNDHFEVTRLLLRSGANLFMVDTHGNDAASHCLSRLEFEDNPSRELFRAVKRAGGWKPYVRAPRIELVRLRSLCARGRARPHWSDPVLQRLFSAPSSSKKATRASKRANRRPLPNEVLWHILGYWRSSREVGA